MREYNVQQHFRVSRVREQTEHQVLFKRRYLDMNLAALLDYLADMFSSSAGLITHALSFGLVNVTAPIQRFSYGTMPTPPDIVQHRGSELVLTFSLSPDSYDEQTVPAYVKRKMRHAFVWSVGGSRESFLTVNLTFTQTGKWGIDKFSLFALKYLYYALGLSTKNLVMFNERYSKYDALDIEHIRGRVYNKAIRKTWDTERYHDWFYNLHIWKYAPNTLSPTLLTLKNVTYFLLYINPRLNKSGTVADDRLLYLLGTTGHEKQTVLSVIMEALDQYGQQEGYTEADYLVLAGLAPIYGLQPGSDVFPMLREFNQRLDAAPFESKRMAHSILAGSETYPKQIFGDGHVT